MRLELFKLWHFVFLGGVTAFFVVFTIFCAIFLRNKKRASKIVVLVLLLTATALHFLRLAFPSSMADASGVRLIHYITPESICAFNAIVFPFFFLFGGRRLKDYMFYVGVFTCVVSVIYPTIIGNKAMEFDTWRFFLMHEILAFVPIIMIITGQHKIDWRWSWVSIYILLGVITIIFANEVMLAATGLIVHEDFAEIFERNGRNIAMIFGPAKELEGLMWFFNALTPPFFRTAPVDVPIMDLAKGDVFWWPIVWVIIPGTVLFGVFFFALSLLFDFKGFWRDIARGGKGKRLTHIKKHAQKITQSDIDETWEYIP